jgi:integrase
MESDGSEDYAETAAETAQNGARRQHADPVPPAHLRDDALLPEPNRRTIDTDSGTLVFDADAGTLLSLEEAARAARIEARRLGQGVPDAPEVIPNLPAARASAPVASQAHAEMVRSDRIRELGIELYELAAGLDVRDPGHRGHLLPLEGLIAAWLAGPLSAHTRRVYRSDIRDFLLWCQTKLINPAVIGWADIAMYARHLETATPDEAHASGEHYAPATRVRYLTSLKSFYTFCYEQEEILRNPCARLRLPDIPDVKRRYVKASDQERLISAAEGYQWSSGGDARRRTMLAIVTVQIDHGWRINEYTTTRLSDLTLVEPETEDEETTLPAGLGAGAVFPAVIRRMKRNKTMTQVLTDRARTAIADMLTGARALPFDWNNPRRVLSGGDAPLFTFKHGRAPHPDTLRVYLDELCRAAGIDPGSDMARRTDRVTFHAMRRASATRKRNKGASLDAVAEDLGHSSTETTRKYYDLHNTDPTRSPAVMFGQATPLTVNPDARKDTQ